MAGLTFKVHTEGMNEMLSNIAKAASKVETTIASEVLSDTSPYVPALTGSLDQRTHVDGNTVVYPGPYARYLYNGKVMVDAATGRGPNRFIGKDGNEMIAFPKGATLTATERDLVFNNTFHPKAQAHWFEASKAQNLDKWVRKAARVVGEEIE